jgi:hypothetical protein
MDQDDFLPPEGFTEDFLFSGRDTPSRRMKRRRKFAHQRRRPTYLELDRQTRRSKAVSLRWRIASDPDGQGVFTTHDILPGSRDWPGTPPGTWAPHAWADFYFMSRKPISQGLFYNAYAKTALEAAALAIEKMAETEVLAKLTEEEQHATRLRSFGKPNADGGSTMIFAPDVGVPSLGGLTKRGAQAQWLREHWDQLATLVEIHPSAELDTQYERGIGLHLIVPETSVDTLTLPHIIKAFLDRGEVAYEDPAIDLAPHLELLKKRLGATLWRWEKQQAEHEGREMDEPDESLWPFFDTHSNAIRM